jgi:isoleucyl-tRNA synthetase
MIENRPDWCVSRQRAWGVPIAVFYCEDCGSLLLDETIMNRVCDLFATHGADIWFEKPPEYFLPEDVACPECGSKTVNKEDDILDVWFDSGVSHAAVLEQRSNLNWPADLYLEGSDQHRGWFHSSLLTAVGTRERAPYKSVLTHGFVVDADGRKMSKSLGNVVAPKEVIDRYGAEILRLWVTASDYREDVRISENILKQLSDAYRRIRNTARFMLGNLYDFNPESDKIDYEEMPEIDRFALHKLQDLTETILAAYENFDFHVIYHRLYNYCTLDLSAFYLDILKDRLYTSPAAADGRRSAQTVMFTIVDTMARLMAPILVFSAEEIWAHMPVQSHREKSIHLTSLPTVRAEWKNEALQKNWERLLLVRGEVTKALELARSSKLIGHPLDAAVTISVPKDMHTQLAPYSEELHSIFIVSQASLVMDEDFEDSYKSEVVDGLKVLVKRSEGEKCERCWIRDISVGTVNDHPTICNRCKSSLEQMGL